MAGFLNLTYPAPNKAGTQHTQLLTTSESHHATEAVETVKSIPPSELGEYLGIAAFMDAVKVNGALHNLDVDDFETTYAQGIRYLQSKQDQCVRTTWQEADFIDLGEGMLNLLNWIHIKIQDDYRHPNGLIEELIRTLRTMLQVDINAMQTTKPYDIEISTLARCFYNINFDGYTHADAAIPALRFSRGLYNSLGSGAADGILNPLAMGLETYAKSARVCVPSVAPLAGVTSIRNVLLNKDPHNILAFLCRRVDFNIRLLANIVLNVGATAMDATDNKKVNEWLKSMRGTLSMTPRVVSEFGKAYAWLNTFESKTEFRLSDPDLDAITTEHRQIVDHFTLVSHWTLVVEQYLGADYTNSSLVVGKLRASDKAFLTIRQCLYDVERMSTMDYITTWHSTMQQLVDTMLQKMPIARSSRFVAAYNDNRPALTSEQRRVSSLLAISTLTNMSNRYANVLMIGQARSSGLHPTDAHYQFIVQTPDTDTDTGAGDKLEWSTTAESGAVPDDQGDDDDVRKWNDFYEECRGGGTVSLDDGSYIILSRFKKLARTVADVFLQEANDRAKDATLMAKCYIPDVEYSVDLTEPVKATLRDCIYEAYQDAMVGKGIAMRDICDKVADNKYANIAAVYINDPNFDGSMVSEFAELLKAGEHVCKDRLQRGKETVQEYFLTVNDGILPVVQYECNGDGYPDGKHWTLLPAEDGHGADSVGVGVMWLGNEHVNPSYVGDGDALNVQLDFAHNAWPLFEQNCEFLKWHRRMTLKASL